MGSDVLVADMGGELRRYKNVFFIVAEILFPFFSVQN